MYRGVFSLASELGILFVCLFVSSQCLSVVFAFCLTVRPGNSLQIQDFRTTWLALIVSSWILANSTNLRHRNVVAYWKYYWNSVSPALKLRHCSNFRCLTHSLFLSLFVRFRSLPVRCVPAVLFSFVQCISNWCLSYERGFFLFNLTVEGFHLLAVYIAVNCL